MHRLFRVFARQACGNSSRHFSSKASAASSLAALPMAVAIAKQPSLGSAPQDGKAQVHHVKDGNGNVTRYQNPYPSFGGGRPKATLIGKQILSVGRIRRIGPGNPANSAPARFGGFSVEGPSPPAGR